MAASVTSLKFPPNPSDPFRHYHSPPKPKQTPKPDQASSRKVDPPLNVPRTGANGTIGPAESDLVPEIGGESLTAGSENTPIAIEDSDSETDSEDPLPTLEELLREIPGRNQEEAAGAAPAVEGLVGDTSTPAAVGYDGHGCGGDGDARQSIQPPGGVAGAEERGPAEHGDGGVGDGDDGSDGSDGSDSSDSSSVTGTDLLSLKQRKRARSVSSDAIVTTHETPGLDPNEALKGPHAPKRQRSYLPPDKGDDSPQASQAATVEARNRTVNECRGAKYKDEAVIAITGVSDASGDGKTADCEDGDYVGGDDAGSDDTDDDHNELLKHLRPATRTASDSHIGSRRAIDNDYTRRTQPPMRVAGRRRMAKPSRETALPATPFARTPAARLVDPRTAGINVRSPPASNQGHHKVTEIFLAVTVQTAGDTLQLSSSEPAKLVESALGYAGKVEDVTIKPLGTAGSWQVSGKFHLRNADSEVPTSVTSRSPMQADSRSELRNRAHSCSVGKGTVGANTTDGEDEDRISDYGHRRLYVTGSGGDGSSGDDDNDDGYGDRGGKVSATGRRNRRWKPSEERQLLAWRREEKSLAWIAGRLDRTAGAVYLRWYTLQRSAQGVD